MKNRGLCSKSKLLLIVSTFYGRLKLVTGAGSAWTDEERAGDYQDEFREIWVQATGFRSVML